LELRVDVSLSIVEVGRGNASPLLGARIESSLIVKVWLALVFRRGIELTLVFRGGIELTLVLVATVLIIVLRPAARRGPPALLRRAVGVAAALTGMLLNLVVMAI
jgi:hypothetical protein